MTDLDDTHRAYEAAKLMQTHVGRTTAALMGQNEYDAAARLLPTNAEAEYRAALIDAAERRFDGLGIKVGETLVCVLGAMSGQAPFIITRLEAVPDDGLVFAFGEDGKCVSAAKLRLYTAPEAKEMVLGTRHLVSWSESRRTDRYRLTLSGITPADLDGMTGSIKGTFTVEKL